MPVVQRFYTLSARQPMKKIKALLVDDEFANRDLMRILLDSYCEHTEVAGMAASVDEAVTQIRAHQPNVVFLDVEMPGKDGFALLEAFPKPDFNVVFVTAHEHYAIRALKNHAFDFLLKPVDTTELQETEIRLLRQIERGENPETGNGPETAGNVALLLDEIRRLKTRETALEKVYIPSTGGFRVLVADEIECVEADGNYTTIYLTDGTKQLTTRSLGDFEQLLSPAVFFRCHKSYLLNLNHLSSFSQSEGKQCTTTSGRQIPVARRKQMEFMERVFQLTGQRNEPPK